MSEKSEITINNNNLEVFNIKKYKGLKNNGQDVIEL